jgi:hypothetical protein
MVRSRGNLGVQSSRECNEYIVQFFACQKKNGLWKKVGGACAEAREDMDRCLYEEYVRRRTDNLAKATERMKRYREDEA